MNESPFLANRKIIYGLLGLIMLAALALRLKGLTTNSLAVDEPWHALLALRPGFALDYWSDRCTSCVCSHPYIFYLVHTISLGLLGPTLLAARLPDALAGTGTVLLGFLIARRVSTPAVGLWTAFLMAFNFTLAGYSQLFRPYGIWIFSTALLIWVGLRARERPSLGRMALLCLLLPLTQQSAYGVLFVAGGVGVLLLASFVFMTDQWKRLWGRIGAYLLILAAVGVFFLRFNIRRQDVLGFSEVEFYEPFFIKSMSLTETAANLVSQFITLLDKFVPFVGQSDVNSLFIALTFFVALVGLGHLAQEPKGRDLLWLLGGTVAAEVLAILTSQWTIHWRHSLYLIVFYLIFLGRGVAAIGEWIAAKRLYPSLILGLALLAILPARAALRSPFIYPGWGSNEFVAELSRRFRSGDAIYADRHAGCALVYLLWADDPDLIAMCTEQDCAKGSSKLRAVEAFGVKAWAILGGGDVSALVNVGPERVWAIVSPNANQVELKAARTGFGPKYRAAETWRPRPSSVNFWIRYDRVTP